MRQIDMYEALSMGRYQYAQSSSLPGLVHAPPRERASSTETDATPDQPKSWFHTAAQCTIEHVVGAYTKLFSRKQEVSEQSTPPASPETPEPLTIPAPPTQQPQSQKQPGGAPYKRAPTAPVALDPVCSYSDTCAILSSSEESVQDVIPGVPQVPEYARPLLPAVKHNPALLQRQAKGKGRAVKKPGRAVTTATRAAPTKAGRTAPIKSCLKTFNKAKGTASVRFADTTSNDAASPASNNKDLPPIVRYEPPRSKPIPIPGREPEEPTKLRKRVRWADQPDYLYVDEIMAALDREPDTRKWPPPILPPIAPASDPFPYGLENYTWHHHYS